MAATVTIMEAAERLKMHPQQVRFLYHEGKIAGEKRLVQERGLREKIFLDAAAVAAMERGGREAGGWRERDPEAVVAEMRGRGYMTAAEAVREHGLSYTANYLSKAIRRGTIAGEVRNVAWIHEGEVARLKRERERKLAAMER